MVGKMTMLWPQAMEQHNTTQQMAWWSVCRGVTDAGAAGPPNHPCSSPTPSPSPVPPTGSPLMRSAHTYLAEARQLPPDHVRHGPQRRPGRRRHTGAGRRRVDPQRVLQQRRQQLHRDRPRDRRQACSGTGQDPQPTMCLKNTLALFFYLLTTCRHTRGTRHAHMQGCTGRGLIQGVPRRPPWPPNVLHMATCTLPPCPLSSTVATHIIAWSEGGTPCCWQWAAVPIYTVGPNQPNWAGGPWPMAQRLLPSPCPSAKQQPPNTPQATPCQSQRAAAARQCSTAVHLPGLATVHCWSSVRSRVESNGATTSLQK